MVTKSFARHIVNFSYDSCLPEELHEARRSFLNWLGCAVGSHRHPAIDTMLRTAALFEGSEQVSFLGTDKKFDMACACMLNGMSSSMYDYDDTYLDTIIHPSCGVFPALFAWYEKYDLPCDSLLKHFIVGAEVQERVGRYFTRAGHYEIGWHITGTTSVFGSVASMGRVMGLSEEEMLNAIGIAATRVNGLRSMFGTQCKPTHAGFAAASGIIAASLAKNGMTANTEVFDGPKSLGALVSRKPEPCHLEEEWEHPCLLMQNSYKPFACDIVAHPATDGACRLYREGVKAEEVEHIHIRVHPLAIELTGRQHPKTQLEAIFSVQHGVAVGLLYGKGGQWQFSDETVVKPEVVALRDKVSYEIDPGLLEDQAEVCLEMKDGNRRSIFVDTTIGSIRKPLSDRDLEDKFRDLVDPYLSRARQNAIIDFCWTLDRQEHIGRLAELCASDK